MDSVFTNSPEDWGLIPGRVILKTQKMVLDAAKPITHIAYIYLNKFSMYSCCYIAIYTNKAMYEMDIECW